LIGGRIVGDSPKVCEWSYTKREESKIPPIDESLILISIGTDYTGKEKAEAAGRHRHMDIHTQTIEQQGRKQNTTSSYRAD
jgi:hypothetical protein